MTMRAIEGAPGATWPEGGGFHSAEGLFFTREVEGGVLVRRYTEHFEGAEPEFALTFTPETWASVVASMEAGGESADSWQAAVNRQRGVPPPACAGDVHRFPAPTGRCVCGYAVLDVPTAI